jgi:transposase
VIADAAPTPNDVELAELRRQLSALQAENLGLQAQVREVSAQRDTFRDAFERLRVELELLKRRIFVATAERIDTTQLELEFKEKLQELEALAGTQDMPSEPEPEPEPKDGKRGRTSKPRGRRDLRTFGLDEQRLELTDELFEKLVADGKATRIGFEESSRLSWQRGGLRVLVIARAKYQAIDARGESVLETTPMPEEALPRSMATPSLLAHVLVAKHCDGLPFARLESILSRGQENFTLDRSVMCRWAEATGGTLGATIVAAMRTDAMCTAFCVATDATGVRIQPERQEGSKLRRPCRRGHFFVQIADRDHILFTYTPRETSAAVLEMFKGYSGYVQADAKSVFDALFRDDGERAEVGCWAHARRKYWEAAVAKSEVAREALARIARIFELDAAWKGRPPNEIRQLRQTHLRPHVEVFLNWAQEEFAKVESVRGALRDALGYTVRQRGPLTEFLADGRLEMTNNGSERALRPIASGRKAWLFCGSDDHAESAAELMSLIASAKLHRLDPERYLRDVIRVLPHWPRDRHLELSPKHWAATRARLNQAQLANDLGPLDVPEPPAEPAAEEPAAD